MDVHLESEAVTQPTEEPAEIEVFGMALRIGTRWRGGDGQSHRSGRSISSEQWIRGVSLFS